MLNARAHAIELVQLGRLMTELRAERDAEIIKLRRVRDKLQAIVLKQDEPVSVRLNGGMTVKP